MFMQFGLYNSNGIGAWEINRVRKVEAMIFFSVNGLKNMGSNPKAQIKERNENDLSPSFPTLLISHMPYPVRIIYNLTGINTSLKPIKHVITFWILESV